MQIEGQWVTPDCEIMLDTLLVLEMFGTDTFFFLFFIFYSCSLLFIVMHQIVTHPLAELRQVQSIKRPFSAGRL